MADNFQTYNEADEPPAKYIQNQPPDSHEGIDEGIEDLDRYSAEPIRKSSNILRPKSNLSPHREGSYGADRQRMSAFGTGQRVSFMGPSPSQFPTTQQNDDNGELVPMKNVRTPRQYMARRNISRLAWFCFAIAVFSLLVTMTIFVAPGWGRTLEIKGFVVAEGVMYGDYGLWFACWFLNEDIEYWKAHDCELIANIPNVPSKQYLYLKVAHLSYISLPHSHTHIHTPIHIYVHIH